MIVQFRFAILGLLAVLREFSKHKMKVSNRGNKLKKFHCLENLLSNNAAPTSKNKPKRYPLNLKKPKNSNSWMKFSTHQKEVFRSRKSRRFPATWNNKSLAPLLSMWLLAGIDHQRSFFSTTITVLASTFGPLAVFLRSCWAWWKRILTTSQIDSPSFLAKVTTNFLRWMERTNRCLENSCNKLTSSVLFSKW